MADTDRISGKTSFFTFNGVNIPITKMEPEIDRALGDTTDSADYNNTSDMIGTTQIPISYTVKGTIEGRFRKSVVPSTLIAGLFTSLTQVPVVFGLNLSPTIWGHGFMDISNFKTSIPVQDIVTYTATFQSWGQFTPNG